MAAVSANKIELLQIADAVAREKSIDRGIVIAAMEDAIAKAARARYGSETDVHAEDRKGTRLNSSHLVISYAVFCLKKKKNIKKNIFADEKYKYLFNFEEVNMLANTVLHFSDAYKIIGMDIESGNFKFDT